MERSGQLLPCLVHGKARLFQTNAASQYLHELGQLVGEDQVSLFLLWESCVLGKGKLCLVITQGYMRYLSYILGKRKGLVISQGIMVWGHPPVLIQIVSGSG